ncbi:F-box protein [Legionella clemsonensis]|uniref:F-box domain-containing protein n=1 Tax=Legionella clemsonensis TaxID=1867846 RepID=A0A222P647_9GAMM|nr:F-box protein [Legionella clemsonensis]ASQ47309.1 hypothetical protein clem_13915 [Legionella clemsonensis]
MDHEFLFFARATSECNSFAKLPNESLTHIINVLSDLEDLATLAQVDTRFNSLISNQRIPLAKCKYSGQRLDEIVKFKEEKLFFGQLTRQLRIMHCERKLNKLNNSSYQLNAIALTTVSAAALGAVLKNGYPTDGLMVLGAQISGMVAGLFSYYVSVDTQSFSMSLGLFTSLAGYAGASKLLTRFIPPNVVGGATVGSLIAIVMGGFRLLDIQKEIDETEEHLIELKKN